MTCSEMADSTRLSISCTTLSTPKPARKPRTSRLPPRAYAQRMSTASQAIRACAGHHSLISQLAEAYVFAVSSGNLHALHRALVFALISSCTT